jgi:hypothetical protein
MDSRRRLRLMRLDLRVRVSPSLAGPPRLCELPRPAALLSPPGSARLPHWMRLAAEARRQQRRERAQAAKCLVRGWPAPSMMPTATRGARHSHESPLQQVPPEAVPKDPEAKAPVRGCRPPGQPYAYGSARPVAAEAVPTRSRVSVAQVTVAPPTQARWAPVRPMPPERWCYLCWRLMRSALMPTRAPRRSAVIRA